MEEKPAEVLTRLPFTDLLGSIYRSPMPYGLRDPEGNAYPDMLRKGITTVVMLASNEEALKKSKRDLRRMYKRDGLNVIQFPITDFGVPERDVLELVLEQVLALARQDEVIAVHCSAGIGRTGLFMAELAKKAMKMSGSEALDWVRMYIDGAVETEEQVRFVVEDN